MKLYFIFIIGISSGIFIYKMYQKKRIDNSTEIPEEKIKNKKDSSVVYNENIYSDSKINNLKEDIATSIKNRHEEGRQIIEESLNTIFSESDNTDISDKKIKDDLDNLLK